MSQAGEKGERNHCSRRRWSPRTELLDDFGGFCESIRPSNRHSVRAAGKPACSSGHFRLGGGSGSIPMCAMPPAH